MRDLPAPRHLPAASCPHAARIRRHAMNYTGQELCRASRQIPANAIARSAIRASTVAFS